MNDQSLIPMAAIERTRRYFEAHIEANEITEFSYCADILLLAIGSQTSDSNVGVAVILEGDL